MEGQKRSGAAAACFAFLGVVEWLEGHPTAAQGYVQDAVEVLSTELGPNHMRVADLLAAIGYMQALRVRGGGMGWDGMDWDGMGWDGMKKC